MPIVLIDSVSERMSHPCLRLLGLVLRGCDLEQGCSADLFVCVCVYERESEGPDLIISCITGNGRNLSYVDIIVGLDHWKCVLKLV